MAYVVSRERVKNFDDKDTNWYTLFISCDKEKAERFLAEVNIYEYETDLHLCFIPLDAKLDIVFWKKYIINTRKWKSDFKITFKKE